MARRHHARRLERVASGIVGRRKRLYSVANAVRATRTRNPVRGSSERVAAAPSADYQTAVRSIGDGTRTAACVVTCGILDAAARVRTAVRFVSYRLGGAIGCRRGGLG